MSNVPGMNALHAIITPNCRAKWTDDGAFNEAVERCRREYNACLKGRGEDGTQYHLVLSVEPPADDGTVALEPQPPPWPQD